MQFFSNKFIGFFSELELNNNREWFNSNKDLFTNFVKVPFEVFIETVINKIREDDDRILITPKEAIFRIYKDVRFSKDKIPYKTNVSAVISEGGRKDFSSPGIYLELSNKGIDFYSGVHFLERTQLQNLREFISDNLDDFYVVINNKKFKRNFGEILGNKNKRIPPEFKEIYEVEPLIANKQFYIQKKMSAEKLLSKNLMKIIMDLYHVAKPLNDFLKIGIQ